MGFLGIKGNEYMRALAREVAFKKIFENLFNQDAKSLDDFFVMDKLELEEDQAFAQGIFDCYIENKEEIETTINNNLVKYDPSRIYKIDRAIISLAVCEMKYLKQTPTAVVINEAVEMAKKYGTEKSYAFVNGILKTISKGL